MDGGRQEINDGKKNSENCVNGILVEIGGGHSKVAVEQGICKEGDRGNKLRIKRKIVVLKWSDRGDYSKKKSQKKRVKK